MGVSIKGALKKLFCFHSNSDKQSDDPSPPTRIPTTETENPPPSTSTSTSTTTAESVDQEEDKIEVYVKSEGEEEVVHKYKVPLKYLSYHTFRGLMERSGEDLDKISSGQKINISCKIELFEKILNFVKSKDGEAKCDKLSYDERLWRRSSSLNGDTRVSNGALGSFLSGRIRY